MKIENVGQLVDALLREEVRAIQDARLKDLPVVVNEAAWSGDGQRQSFKVCGVQWIGDRIQIVVEKCE